MNKITILGTGTVGQTFATRLSSIGYEVMMGTRNVKEKLASTEKDGYGNPPFGEWYDAHKDIKLGTFEDAASFSNMIINATSGGNSINALKQAGAAHLAGKILVDVANPLDFSHGMPPSLLPGLCNTNSLGEEIQKTFPETKVVKTLNTMWCGLMVNPGMIASGGHTVFICGNDTDAKTRVVMWLTELGWKKENVLDLGDISSARGTEALLPLWLRIFTVTKNGAFNFKVVS